MTLEAFSQAWAEAWASELNASETYRTAAATWEGAVALFLDDPDPAGRKAVLLDLWHGRCRSARATSAGELDDAAYVFQGDRTGWTQVLADGGSPVIALMSGKIRLAKGSLVSLLPYVQAAKELLKIAGSVPTHFPGR